MQPFPFSDRFIGEDLKIQKKENRTMKKNLIRFILCGTMLLSATGVSAAKYSFELSDTLNIEESETYKNGEHTMIPLRKAAESIGFTVEWNGDEQSVVLDNGVVNTKVVIGTDSYYITRADGKGMENSVAVGAAPEIKNDTTYVPAVMFNILNRYLDLPEDQESTPAQSHAKVMVNISGKITATDNNKITLDSGKVVVITDSTVFSDDPDMGEQEVSREFKIGNFICGYTTDDPNLPEVTAARIYQNIAD